MTNLTRWMVLAQDFNSPFIRNYIWTLSPFKLAELFNVPRAAIGIASRKNEIHYFGDMDTWKDAYEGLKKKTEEDYLFVNRLIDETNACGEAFNVWSEQEIFIPDLSQKTPDQLIVLLKEFVDKQSILYAYGITLPMLDFQGFSFVERNLEQFLKENVSQEDFSSYYALFTFPLENSFALDQEEGLFRLMSEFYSDNVWLNDIKEKSMEVVTAEYPEFSEKLSLHTKKYAWVYYVYMGPAFTDKQFYEFIKEYVQKGVDPIKKLADMKEKREYITKKKEEYIVALRPDTFNEMILRLAGKIVWAKPRRKDYQSRSYYHFEKLLREISRRLFISLDQARSATVDMLEEALKKGIINEHALNSIFKQHVCLPQNEGVVQILYGAEAEEFFNAYIKIEELEIGNITELKGTTAHPGKKVGVVKVINKPEEMHKMLEGDILVSIATTPNIVPAMKKAAAIVTDEGGLTCHAAIVSRELGITCVIGTKIATRILKDGDRVEVDADKGIVTIIS